MYVCVSVLHLAPSHSQHSLVPSHCPYPSSLRLCCPCSFLNSVSTTKRRLWISFWANLGVLQTGAGALAAAAAALVAALVVAALVVAALVNAAAAAAAAALVAALVVAALVAAAVFVAALVSAAAAAAAEQTRFAAHQ